MNEALQVQFNDFWIHGGGGCLVRTRIAAALASVLWQPLERYTRRAGLSLGALAQTVDADALAKLPESARGWYVEKEGKFVLDLEKVEVEDTGALKTALEREKTNAKTIKQTAERTVADLQKKFEGIDPERTRAMLARFASDEERKEIEAGNIDAVIERRMEKQRADLEAQVKAAGTDKDKALAKAQQYMERVLDNHVRAAAVAAGIVYPGSIEDACTMARRFFSLNDKGEAVQFMEDGETVLMSKDPKKPFSLADWFEERKADRQNWFPAGASGGGSKGDGGGGKGRDLSGLSPQQRLTMAREKSA